MFVSDDRVAIIGTINMDYRSFYLHFENGGVAFYGSSVVQKVHDDIRNTLDVSRMITMEFVKNRSWIKKLAGMVLKLAAPPLL